VTIVAEYAAKLVDAVTSQEATAAPETIPEPKEKRHESSRAV
jgi:hypothetical protein